MIKREDIIADFHIHTVGSLHAYSTLKECIDSAKENGMKYIAITDHYYNDGTKLNKKHELNRIVYLEHRAQKSRSGVSVIGGAEFNIAQEIPDWKKLKKLKWKLIGIHSWFLDRAAATIDEVYQYFEEAAEAFNAFAHIERELYKIDNGRYGSQVTYEIKDFFDKMVKLAKDKDIILELNESSLVINEKGGYDRIVYWLMKAKENGNIISLGTDSHYCEEIGRFDLAIELLNQIGYPKEKILNCNEDMIREYFDMERGVSE